jgi:hypothetical protein
MTSELAKQLKDAGFPIKPYPEWALQMDGPMGEAEYRENYRPTLSELIEACGDDFYGLEKCEVYSAGFGADVPREHRGTSWFAKASGIMIQADSAEEAVAKLWLALNAKWSPESHVTRLDL